MNPSKQPSWCKEAAPLRLARAWRYVAVGVAGAVAGVFGTVLALSGSYAIGQDAALSRGTVYLPFIKASAPPGLLASGLTTSALNHSWASAPQGPRVDPQHVQLGIVASMKPQYVARLEANLRGWHTSFANIHVYAYDGDPVPARLARRLAARNVTLHLVAPFGPDEATGWNNNLHQVALEGLYRENAAAAWFFVAEDDTVVSAPGLVALTQELERGGGGDVIKGRCVMELLENIPASLQGPFAPLAEALGGVPFVVGGAGLLLSRPLVAKLAPKLAGCRVKYNAIPHGDAKVGACALADAGLRVADRFAMCVPRGYAMANFGMEQACSESEFSELGIDYAAGSRVVSLHEKDPRRIRALNAELARMHAAGETPRLRHLGRLCRAVGLPGAGTET